YTVEAVQSGFPDCEAKRQIAPQRWQRVHPEFEFESRNFRDHGHSLTGCDVIVCWRHNWPDCPPHIQVLELSSLIKTLPTSPPYPAPSLNCHPERAEASAFIRRSVGARYIKPVPKNSNAQANQGRGF